MDTKRVGRRIKAFRKLKGLTQIDLAKEMDIPIAQLGAVERGTEEASEGVINLIADTLDVCKKELVSKEISQAE